MQPRDDWFVVFIIVTIKPIFHLHCAFWPFKSTQHKMWNSSWVCVCVWIFQPLYVNSSCIRGATLFSCSVFLLHVAVHWDFSLLVFIFSAAFHSSLHYRPTWRRLFLQFCNETYWRSLFHILCTFPVISSSWQYLSITLCGSLRSSGLLWMKASGRVHSHTTLIADRKHGVFSPTCLSTPGMYQHAVWIS